MRDDIQFWLGLLRFPKFGPVRMGRLLTAFPNMRLAFEANAADLLAAGIEPRLVEQFIQARANIDPARELAKLTEAGITAVTRVDANYPPSLLTIYDPPAVLFVRGSLPDPMRLLLAVVGSRHATNYGLTGARTLAGDAAKAGIGIVSGLAYGIDATAHEAALEVGGYTMAVLGSGIDDASIYPSQHRALASRIAAAGGAIVSEYLPGTPSLPQHFPIRNRVIAGLCRATLVIEATEKSGSLITARAALESGRDVFAMPGPINSPLSSGPHELIKNGALCATSAADILGALGIERAPAASVPVYVPADADEAKIYAVLSQSPQHADELVEATGLPAPLVSGILTRLEIDGRVKDAGGLHFVRT